MKDTVYNAIQLVKELMKKHNISIGNVLRHYDVTGKKCPEPFVRDASQWIAFKQKIEEKDMEKSTIKICVNGLDKYLEGYNVEGTNYVTIRDLCSSLGVTVAYDNATKTVVLTK